LNLAKITEARWETLNCCPYWRRSGTDYENVNLLGLRFVHMFVTDTSRDLMAKGIIPAANMLPEVAYVKLAWALGSQ